jgi:integral membrane protein
MQTKDPKKLMQTFRMIAIAEGISFLILLLVAMPLKYIFHFPQAVNVFGWVHGALFISFVYLAFSVMTTYNKPISWFFKAFLASILPFGTFVLDNQLKKEVEAA